MDIEKVAREFIGILKQLGIKYAVVGGVAVHIHGLPRPTWDVDLVVQLSDEQAARLMDAAEEEGFLVDENARHGWRDTLQQMPMLKFKTYVEDGTVDVDLFLSETEFLKKVIDRRVSVESPELTAEVITPEDLILMKLLAHRNKDLADIDDIFFVQGQLDVAHLRLWADRLNVRSRLEAFLGKLE